MILEEDHGNLGNLIAYLNGADPLEERLEKATKIFFIPLSIPPEHKEEVVLLWIADILSTNKILNYSSEERELTWKCFRKLLTSRRLQALCSHHWVCSFTSSFIQTLLSTVSETTTPATVKEEAFLICQVFMNTPHLSPQISLLKKDTLKLCNSLLASSDLENVCPTLSSLLFYLLQKVPHILNHEMTQQNALDTIYEKILFPLLKLAVTQQESSDAETKKLLLEINKFMKNTVFSNNFCDTYKILLKLPTHPKSESSMSDKGNSCLNAFILHCINHERSDTVGVNILKTFAYFFFDTRKSWDIICYQFMIIVMHLLGISVQDSPLSREEKNIAPPLESTEPPDFCRDRFMLAIFESLLNSNFDGDPIINKIPMKKWIGNLGTYILNTNILTEDALKCVSIIAKIEPLFLVNHPSVFTDLLACNKSMNEACIMLDKLLCDILDIHVKLRTVHQLFTQLSENILALNNKYISDNVMFHETWVTYDENHLIPINFMRNLVTSVKRMGTQMWLNLWQHIVQILSKTCREALQQGENNEKVCLVASVVWLSSVCFSATSFTEMASVSGMASHVSDTMNVLALECIKPLVMDTLQLSQSKSVLARSLMNLMLVWSEFHVELHSTEMGYKEQTKFPWKPIWECDSPKDFSSQVPFLDSETWTKITSTCLNEKEDVCRFWIIQFLVQKVALIKAQSVKHKAHGMPIDNSVVSRLSSGCLSLIFDVNDTSDFPLSTDIVAFHLPTLASSLKKSHWDQISRMFIAGIEEDRKLWIEFGKSSFFQDCEHLHSYCFSHLCKRISLLLSGGKRKRSEEEIAKMDENCKSKYLSRKVVLHLIKSQTQTSSNDLELYFSFLDALLRYNKREKSLGRLSKRSQSEVLGLLQILELYPLSGLHPNLTLSVVAFLLVVLVEEGGLNGRREIVCWVLHLLNRTVTSQHVDQLFAFLKKKPYFIFMWLLDQGDQLLESYSIEDAHLKVILEGQEPPGQKSDLIGELLYLVRTLTESFLVWNNMGKQVIFYAKALSRDYGEEIKLKEMDLLYALVLQVHLKKRVENWKTVSPQLLGVLKTLGQWSLKVSQSVNLSDVTRVVLANCLASFSSLLYAAEKSRAKEHNQAGRQKAAKRRKTEENQTKKGETTFVQGLEDFDWESLIGNGVRLSRLVADTENPQLEKLCLSFFLTVANSSQSYKSIGKLAAFQKALPLIPFDEELEDNQIVHSIFKSLPIRSYRKLLETLLKEVQTAPFESKTLSQWFLVVVTEPPDPSLRQVKFEAMEELLSVFSIQIACSPDLSKTGGLLPAIKILEAVLKADSNIPAYSKALILHIFPKVASYTRSSPVAEFTKVFDGAAQLLYLLLRKEYYLVCDRPAPIASAIIQLAFTVMDRADETDQNLSPSTVVEIQKCSSEVERIVRELRNFDFVFTKIIPFSLAKIVQKIQRTQLCPVIKESMERVVYHLLDFSDIYILRHLMVALPPSVTTLLKYHYETFNHNFRFNPKTD